MSALLRSARNGALGLLNRMNVLVVDYPVRPQPRYGHGKPPHAELAALLGEHRDSYAGILAEMASLDDRLQAISDTAAPSSGEPQWRDRFTGGLDGIALYCFVAMRKPRRFFEIGSGNSTKFVARAIRDSGLQTELVSIDPHPRAEVDRLCNRTLRSPLEAIDLSVFDELASGDILYVDNSHRALQNSDVTVFFLDVLPRLAPGVLVGIDDIHLPFDYPPEWRFRYYSEQYLLACYLLARGRRIRPVLPAAFVSADPQLLALLTRSATLARIDPRGTAFWLETAG
jgi:methyltransferase family protein